MPYIVVGLSHRTAPVEVRERMAFSRAEAGEAAVRLKAMDGFQELLVLSTCNRTEVVAAPRESLPLESAVRGVRDYLCASRSVDPAELDRYLYAYEGPDAVRHVFRVACSLDSMVVGEPQILGQVKEAYGAASRAGALGPALEALLQRAFAVAKRIRSGTQIARNPVSISYAAAELAGRIFGSLEGRAVMIVGAGKMAELAAKHLVAGGAGTIYVASRTFHHAQETARRYNGVPLTFDQFRDFLVKSDIVISSTAAPHYVLLKEDVQRLMRQRKGRPIFLIDIAVPRDIDPAVNALDNVYLYDIDDLQKVVDAGLEERRREAARAEEMIEQEVAQFNERDRARSTAPTIVALRDRLQGLARDEILRRRASLGPLTAEQEKAIQDLLSSVMNKVAHGPTREIKRAGGRGGGKTAVALVRRMFDLPEAVEDDEPPWDSS